MSTDPTIPPTPKPSAASQETVATPTSATHSMAPRRDPPKIGNYRIRRHLGEGGMGAVYEAEQENPRRLVALKVIRPGLLSPTLLRRFEHEAHLLGRLHHPGIAQIFEAGTADAGYGPQPYFAMEYIERGRPLSEYAAEKKLGTRSIIELVAKVCDAVHHAHQKGIIHRDLKPANILVDETVQPKILDFGIAKATESDMQVTTMHTDVGQIVGTLPYMSPEQVAADPTELDTRSDVYALGVILYELLTRKLPYEVSRKLVHEAVRIIREQEPTRLSVVSKVFRGDVETIVAKAMEKDKARRYQSAAELAADLRRYLLSEPLSARPPSALYQFKKFARRNKALVGGVVAAFIVLVIGAAVSTWFAVQATRQHARAENNFQVALAAVDKFFTQVSESPDLKSHGLEKLRRDLLGTAKDYYDSFVESKKDDPTRQAELARAQWRLGNIDRELGELGRAETAFRASVRIFDSLLERFPEDGTIRRDWMSAYTGFGLVLADRSKFAEAEKTYQKVLALEPAIESMTGDRAALLEWIASAYDNYGVLLLNTGRLRESEVVHKKSLEIRQRLNPEYGESPIHRFNLVSSYCNLASNLARSGRPQEALAPLLEAIPIGEKLMTEHPGIPMYQNAVSAALNNLGGVQTLLGDNESARKSHHRSLAIRQEMLRDHPDVLEYAVRLSGSLTNLGEIEVRENNPAPGLEWLDKSVAELEAVLSREPNEATAKYHMSYTQSWRAKALEKLGRCEEALAAWDRALQLDTTANPEIRAGRAASANNCKR